MVSGWQLTGAAEAGGGTAAACVVGADAGFAGAGELAGVARVGLGCAFCVAVADCEAGRLGAPVAVGEAVVVRPVVVPLSGEDDDPPEVAATMTTISATKARTPVSALWRAGQDLPR